MKVDSVHPAIKNKLRRRQIVWPAEYVEVITSARKRQPYKVVQVAHTFFKDFLDLRHFWGSIIGGYSQSEVPA